MNLPDLLRRKDRAVSIDRGAATPADDLATMSGRMRGITLAPGTRLTLLAAHEYAALRDFPSDPAWRLVAGEGVRVSIVPHGGGAPRPLAVTMRDATAESAILFDWPVEAAEPHDLAIEAIGEAPVAIAIGRLLDPRAKMRPLIRGRGLELGPGLSPRILPAPGIDIEYVEEKHPDEWQATYGHGTASTAALTPDVMARYRVGSALTLAEWPAASLDFIFSNHVFEHLHNPLQVIENWLGRLKPGGALLAVIPDTRFTFDLRQPCSTLAEMIDEQAAGGFAVPDGKYAKWCAGTAPYNTIENLKARRYSIHVHYYTPAILVDMIAHLAERGACRTAFIDSAPNNKEFGVIVRR